MRLLVLLVTVAALSSAAAAQGTILAVYVNGTNLDTINRATGATISSVSLTPTTGGIMGCTGIAQDPTTGTIYLSVRNSPSAGTNDISLATVDRTTGTVVKIGPFTTTVNEAVAGLQFNTAGQLFAITGDYVNTGHSPATLFLVNKATGSMSTTFTGLGTTDMGETIGFDPTNTAVMYHWSGNAVTQVYETVNLSTGTQTPVTTTGVPANVSILCMGWDSEAQWFWTCTNVNQFGYIRPNGQYVQGFGVMAGQAKGILVLPTSVPSVSTLPLGTTTQGTASTPVSFNLNGSNLFGDITITAPSGVEVSLTAGSGYTNSLAVPRSSASGELNQTQIFARITSGAPQGAISANLTLTTLGGNQVDISVTGQVDPPPTPPEMDVLNGVTPIADGGTDAQGIVTIGVSQMITYTIQNSGSLDLNLTGTPLVAVANANNVQNLSVSIAPSTPIAGMSSDTFEITYEAIAVGAFSFTVSIDNNDSNENPYNWTVNGTAQAVPPPEMDVLNGATAIASGGNDAQGPQPPLMTHTITYTIENNGGSNLLLNGTPVVAVTPGTNIVSAVVNVMPASSIAAAGSATFDLAYEVGGTGAFDISISIDNNDPDENPYTWSVTGMVMVTPPEIDVTRGGNTVADGGTDTLPTQQIGNISVTYTITNSGGSTLSVGTATISGETNCAVVISAQPSSNVAVAGTTTLELVVTPAAAGAYSFAISIPNNDSNEDPYDINVNGNVTAPPSNNDDGGDGGDEEGGCSTGESVRSGLAVLLALLASAAVVTRMFRSRAHA